MRRASFLFLLFVECVNFLTPLNAQLYQRFESSLPKMGSSFKITLYTSDSLYAQEVFSRCWARVDELNSIFSDYVEDSEASLLSDLAGMDEWLPVSYDLWNVLLKSNDISIQSEGAFDVTLGAVTKLWRRSIRHNELPTPQDIIDTKKCSGYKWIEFHPTERQIKIKKKGLRFDFGAIAKGYAVDEVFKILRQQNITSALVDGGGDLYIGAHPSKSTQWNIEVFHDHLRTIKVENKAIASSGSMYKNVSTSGYKYGHIIEPESGTGVKSELNDDQIITVIAPSCLMADALATALSVIGEQDRDRLMKKYPNCSFFTSNLGHKE